MSLNLSFRDLFDGIDGVEIGVAMCFRVFFFLFSLLSLSHLIIFLDIAILNSDML